MIFQSDNFKEIIFVQGASVFSSFTPSMNEGLRKLLFYFRIYSMNMIQIILLYFITKYVLTLY